MPVAVRFVTTTLGARLGTKGKKDILSCFCNEVNIGYKTFSSFSTRMSPRKHRPLRTDCLGMNQDADKLANEDYQIAGNEIK